MTATAGPRGDGAAVRAKAGAAAGRRATSGEALWRKHLVAAQSYMLATDDPKTVLDLLGSHQPISLRSSDDTALFRCYN